MRCSSVACAVTALLFACQRPAPAPAAAPSAERPAERAPTPAIPAAPGRSDEHCVGPLETPGTAAPLRPRAGKLVIGVLAGLKDTRDENLASLRTLVAELKRRGAEALIA